MYDMEYRIICENWKYRIQYKRLWFWKDLPVIMAEEDLDPGGVILDPLSPYKEFETYQGALQYLRRHLGREAIIKETRFI